MSATSGSDAAASAGVWGASSPTPFLSPTPADAMPPPILCNPAGASHPMAQLDMSPVTQGGVAGFEADWPPIELPWGCRSWYRRAVSQGPVDPSLARHLDRITAYMRSAGLQPVAPEQTELRRT